jgi:hypothetical protein
MDKKQIVDLLNSRIAEHKAELSRSEQLGKDLKPTPDLKTDKTKAVLFTKNLLETMSKSMFHKSGIVILGNLLKDINTME